MMAYNRVSKVYTCLLDIVRKRPWIQGPDLARPNLTAAAPRKELSCSIGRISHVCKRALLANIAVSQNSEAKHQTLLSEVF